MASPRLRGIQVWDHFLGLSAPQPGETSSMDSPEAGDAQVWHPPGRLSGLPKLMILQTCDSRIIRRYLLLSSLLRGTTNMASPRQALRACPKLMTLQACDTCITRQLKYCITPTRGTQVWSPLLRQALWAHLKTHDSSSMFSYAQVRPRATKGNSRMEPSSWMVGWVLIFHSY